MERSQLGPSGSGEPFPTHGAPTDSSPLSQPVRQQGGNLLSDNQPESQRNSTLLDDETDAQDGDMNRADSALSQSNTLLPSRGGTLKKKQSLKKSNSLVRRSGSRRSLRAGSVQSLALGEKEKSADGQGDEFNSAFYTPVPTTGNPTEVLAARFQAWRKVLKDLVTYFREIQRSYETRAKSLLSVSNLINNTSFPPMFLTEGGVGDATHILRDYHKQSLAEGNKAKSIEEDVIVQLSGLRADLQQKVKEIKNLSGDFKNNVPRETEGTRRAVRDLQEALGLVDSDPSATTGKGDPYLVKLGVDRQVERQIDEENYLHRAFLNLENSGRELESIVVGEIQKAYNAYASIIKREADEAYEAVERLRTGPVGLPKDYEWDAYVKNNEHFVDPDLPIRKVENIQYAGKEHPAAAEVRAGLLERKSKYLKSYTPGWYVLSPTHLHEFKSPDRVAQQTPVMSLYLPEQKLGSHSNTDSSSHKFMLKGRQTGSMHRGHGWVFRAETYDTMMAWFNDIKSLTEKTGEERNAYVRKHARSLSGSSQKAPSINSDGALDEDEADEVPYSATAPQFEQSSPVAREAKLVERPQPGGRFPSDINVNRNLQVPLSPSSGSSDDRDVLAPTGAATGVGAAAGVGAHQHHHRQQQEQQLEQYQQQPQQPQEQYTPSQERTYERQGIAHDDKAYHPSTTTNERSLPQSGPSGAQQHPTTLSGGPSSVEPIPQSQNSNIFDDYVGRPRDPSTIQTERNSSKPRDISNLRGAEYYEQPVQSGGFSSDGPGNVAYATPRQEPPPSQAQAPALPPHEQPVQSGAFSSEGPCHTAYAAPRQETAAPLEEQTAPALPPHIQLPQPQRHDSDYGEWMAPTAAAAGAGGAAAALVRADAAERGQAPTIDYRKPMQQEPQGVGNYTNDMFASPSTHQPQQQVPPPTTSYAPAPFPQQTASAFPVSSKDAPPFSPVRSDGASEMTDLSMASTAPGDVRAFGTESSSAVGRTGAARPDITTIPSYTSAQTISDLHVPGEYPKAERR
ncbi:hypothetical protein MMC25_004650 [Agyrium rufum]|nr:hypothetical protein [Agyrium rufum]